VDSRREGNVSKRVHDGARRKQQELQITEDDLKHWNLEVARRVATASRHRARVKELRMLLETARSKEADADEGLPQTVELTDRALSALKDLLDRTPHDSDQALRLTSESAEGPTIVVDNVKEGDYVAVLDEQPILIVETPTPAGLFDVTLDLDDQRNGVGLRPPLKRRFSDRGDHILDKGTKHFRLRPGSYKIANRRGTALLAEYRTLLSDTVFRDAHVRVFTNASVPSTRR